ncbi:hypothetical protein MNB_SV-12-1356 [hydrothermal vent metagenome]|uniref:Uncharacterized protein n=1 Tax=hydrothermal vent metagenome TaxID=652676 RepID=A0A1W1CLB0_9ZZZZ
MSAIINHSYFDFFTIAIEAYNSQNKNIYRKLMITLISTYKALINEIELSSSYLDKTEKLHYLENELETFYDNMYDSMDIIKLYKKRLEELKNQDGLFADLYEVIDKLYLVMIEHLDRVSTLEVKSIQQKYAKVS